MSDDFGDLHGNPPQSAQACWINTPDQSDASHDANRYTAFGLPDALGRPATSASAKADCIVPGNLREKAPLC
jgi:hypothetical protein